MFKAIEANEKLSDKILRQITELIRNGELNPGDKLPPERQLAEMMGVSRPALKQTISILEAMGIVESRQGDGNYILPYQGKIFNPLVLSFYASHGNTDDILEVRYILEVQNAKIAALKRTEEQLERLGNIVERMKGVKNLQERIDLNNEFHLELIMIGGNPLIVSFYNGILELIGEQIANTDGEEFYEHHKKLYDVIYEKDSEGAARAMMNHFTVKFPNYKYYTDII